MGGKWNIEQLPFQSGKVAVVTGAALIRPVDLYGCECIGPDGFLEIRGYPSIVDSDDYSKDEKDCRTLMESK